MSKGSLVYDNLLAALMSCLCLCMLMHVDKPLVEMLMKCIIFAFYIHVGIITMPCCMYFMACYNLLSFSTNVVGFSIFRLYFVEPAHNFSSACQCFYVYATSMIKIFIISATTPLAEALFLFPPVNCFKY